MKVQALTLVPQVEVAFDRDRAQQVGVTPAVVRDTVATMLRGVKVGEVFDAQKIFDVVVWGAPEVRSDVFALRRMPIELPAGGYTPLASVADVRVTPTPNEITREGGSRRIDITCNVRGPRPRRGGARHRGGAGGRPVRRRLPPGSARRVRGPRRVAAAAARARASCRCCASCWCCTSTSGRCGWSRSSR